MHPDPQRERDGKRRLSDEIIFVSDDERWNDSPLFNKHKSIFIDDDKQQVRIQFNKCIN